MFCEIPGVFFHLIVFQLKLWMAVTLQPGIKASTSPEPLAKRGEHPHPNLQYFPAAYRTNPQVLPSPSVVVCNSAVVPVLLLVIAHQHSNTTFLNIHLTQPQPRLSKCYIRSSLRYATHPFPTSVLPPSSSARTHALQTLATVSAPLSSSFT